MKCGYEMKVFGENCPDSALWQGMIPLGGVFKNRNIFSAWFIGFYRR